VELGGMTREEIDRIVEERRNHFDEELKHARSEDYEHQAQDAGRNLGRISRRKPKTNPDVDTGVDRDRLSQLLESQTRFPDELPPAPKNRPRAQTPRKMAQGEEPLDWAAAESLAYASLATEGIRVRMSGQDSERGTFSHRHAVCTILKTARTYVPLQHLADDQAPVEIYNSPLSEAGVWGSSTATASTARTAWCSGKPSSAISSTPAR
jgi:2-oxoglutarate dehydrogenase E1 component